MHGHKTDEPPLAFVGRCSRRAGVTGFDCSTDHALVIFIASIRFDEKLELLVLARHYQGL
jgi:hypothetical protein